MKRSPCITCQKRNDEDYPNCRSNCENVQEYIKSFLWQPSFNEYTVLDYIIGN